MTPQESHARDEICRVGASLFARGYVHATAGNISVRLSDGYLITPTDACLGLLDPARLARLNLDGIQAAGDRASKTIALHRSIYEATAGFNEQVACIIHTHSRHCVALTLTDAALPTALGPELLGPLTPYFVMKVGHVPLLPYHRPGDPAVATFVGQTLRRYAQQGLPLRAVMLARLGPNVWHQTPAAAMATLEELEETARLRTLTGPAVTDLSAADLSALAQQFGCVW